jgi:hypothetical protein
MVQTLRLLTSLKGEAGSKAGKRILKGLHRGIHISKIDLESKDNNS